MAIDLEGITFIYHVRIDTKERAKNIEIIYNFYKKNCKNFFNIFIEDDNTQQLYNLISFDKNDKYIFKENKDIWNKCKSFNEGIKLSNSNILVFHDLDIIQDPNFLLKAKHILEADTNGGLLYPYNGLFFYVSKQLKENIAKSLDYNDFLKLFPSSKTIGYTKEGITVGHYNSVGGCTVGRKDNIVKAGGYNPNFIGWGYEDNEFPRRLHTLGYNVSRITDKNAALWHLPHDGPGATLKETNPYHEQNRQMSDYVNSASRIELAEYIKKWSSFFN
jgi:predicted glycosyltransferase involved in capsule biosynthesis